MWYQQSPAKGGRTWRRLGSTESVTQALGAHGLLCSPQGGWGPCPADLQHPGLSQGPKEAGAGFRWGWRGRSHTQGHMVPSPACGQEPALQLLRKPKALSPMWRARHTSHHLFIRPFQCHPPPCQTLSRHPVKNTPA